MIVCCSLASNLPTLFAAFAATIAARGSGYLVTGSDRP